MIKYLETHIHTHTLTPGVDWALSGVCTVLQVARWPARLTLASAWPLLIGLYSLNHLLVLRLLACISHLSSFVS